MRVGVAPAEHAPKAWALSRAKPVDPPPWHAEAVDVAMPLGPRRHSAGVRAVLQAVPGPPFQNSYTQKHENQFH